MLSKGPSQIFNISARELGPINNWTRVGGIKFNSIWCTNLNDWHLDQLRLTNCYLNYHHLGTVRLLINAYVLMFPSQNQCGEVLHVIHIIIWLQLLTLFICSYIVYFLFFNIKFERRNVSKNYLCNIFLLTFFICHL